MTDMTPLTGLKTESYQKGPQKQVLIELFTATVKWTDRTQTYWNEHIAAQMISHEVGEGHEALDDPFQLKGIQYPALEKSWSKFT